MNKSTYNGFNLIKWGLKPGPWFKNAIEKANTLFEKGVSETDIIALLQEEQPTYLEMRDPLKDKMVPFNVFLEPDTPEEQKNYDAVMKTMKDIMRVPVVTAGAVMPDACPAGTIPVGGVGVSEMIHPNYHSADVCCSMAITILDKECDPKELLDIIQELTHFGPTRREHRPVDLPAGFTNQFKYNEFLSGLEDVAIEHFSTQGDGNHFYYVGRIESSNRLAIVSHHGSRGFGAKVYKRGKTAAERYTQTVAPSVPKAHAWLDVNTKLGFDYWEALWAVRSWTKLNHFRLHDEALKRVGSEIEARFWNPHNFVFINNDGKFAHAKGATPSYTKHSHDDSNLSLIPMNMAEPILITAHTNNEHALGFAPHGAGRNVSRTEFLRNNSPSQPEGIDVRFWSGREDKSELPQAYKKADKIIASIKENNLARVVNRVMPYGSIMAGDCDYDAPWMVKRRAKLAAKNDNV